MKRCKVPLCSEKHLAKGFCKFHYHQDYNRRNKEKMYARSRKWIKENPEKYRKSYNKWLDRNWEYWNEYQLAEYHRRKQQKELEND